MKKLVDYSDDEEMADDSFFALSSQNPKQKKLPMILPVHPPSRENLFHSQLQIQAQPQNESQFIPILHPQVQNESSSVGNLCFNISTPIQPQTYPKSQIKSPKIQPPDQVRDKNASSLSHFCYGLHDILNSSSSKNIKQDIKRLGATDVNEFIQLNRIKLERNLKVNYDFKEFQHQFFILFLLRITNIDHFQILLDKAKLKATLKEIFALDYRTLFQEIEKRNIHDPLYNLLTTCCLTVFHKPENWAFDILSNYLSFRFNVKKCKLSSNMKELIKQTVLKTTSIYNDNNNIYSKAEEERKNDDNSSDADSPLDLEQKCDLTETNTELDLLLNTKVLNNIYYFPNHPTLNSVYGITSFKGYIFLNDLYEDYEEVGNEHLKVHLLFTILHEMCHAKRLFFKCSANILKKSTKSIEVGWYYEAKLLNGRYCSLAFLRENPDITKYFIISKNIWPVDNNILSKIPFLNNIEQNMSYLCKQELVDGKSFNESYNEELMRFERYKKVVEHILYQSLIYSFCIL